MLSIAQNKIHVHVICSPIERPREEEKPRVQVKETRTSCFAELQRIVQQAVSAAKVELSDVHGALVIRRPRGFFGGEGSMLLSIDTAAAPHVRYLFMDGVWDNLKIVVFDES